MISPATGAASLAALLLATALQSAPASAQDITLEQRLEAAETLFDQLDSEAEQCLQELEEAAPDAAGKACSRFMNTVDGDAVAQYLDHCSALTRWRDNFVSIERDETSSAAELNRIINRLRGVEYYCSEDALSRRTEFVQTAFNRLRSTGSLGASYSGWSTTTPGVGANRPLPSPSVYQSHQRQRQRLRGETNQLWNDVEIDLLRRQLERSRDWQGGR